MLCLAKTQYMGNEERDTELGMGKGLHREWEAPA